MLNMNHFVQNVIIEYKEEYEKMKKVSNIVPEERGVYYE